MSDLISDSFERSRSSARHAGKREGLRETADAPPYRGEGPSQYEVPLGVPQAGPI